MRPRPLRLAGLLAGVLVTATLCAGGGSASAARIQPGQVVVTPQPGSLTAAAVGTAPVTVATRPGETVHQAITRLRKAGGVKDAVPNFVAHAAAAPPYVPNDPGRHTTPGNWRKVQWNFDGEYGVHAPQAWGNLIAAGRPGGQGVLVAVLDTGVAYTHKGGAKISPDLSPSSFVPGYDFVDHDPLAIDRNGHGTHVASTIVEATNNGRFLTGLAYGTKVLPVRVLDNQGEGDATTIARGVRYAVRKGAKIINMSLEFGEGPGIPAVTARDIPQLIDALRYAREQGVLVVGVSGNEGRHWVDYPARDSSVLAVGASTEHGCLSDFSNYGKGIDIVAPGGGDDAGFPSDDRCDPVDTLRNISQVTLTGVGSSRFSISVGYEGTSMAAPHVSATAALVVASGVLGPNPSPAAITARLNATARDLGARGTDRRYGHGLVDAGAATAAVTAG
jgi:serine protease